MDIQNDGDNHIRIVDCGVDKPTLFDINCKNNRGRSDYTVIYIASGKCDVYINRNFITAVPGSVIIYKPYEPQILNYKVEDKPIAFYFHFEGRGAPLLRELDIYELEYFFMGISSAYEEIFHKMLREYSIKQNHWSILSLGYLYEILSLIARKHTFRINNINIESEQRIIDACNIICDNISRSIDVEQLANFCCLSVSRFNHLFKEIVGESPHKFLMSLRFDKAKSLLENNSLSIQEISHMLGFTDQNYFSRVFKSRYGISPTEWRALRAN